MRRDRGLARALVLVVGVSLAILAAGVVWGGWFGLRTAGGHGSPDGAALSDIRGVNAERIETLGDHRVVRVVVDASLSRANLEHTIDEVRSRFSQLYPQGVAGQPVAPVIEIGSVLMVPGSERLPSPVAARVVNVLKSDVAATEIRLAESLEAQMPTGTTPLEALQELRLLTAALPADEAVPGGYFPRVNCPDLELSGYGDLAAMERLLAALSAANVQVRSVSLTYGWFSAEAPEVSVLAGLSDLRTDELDGWSGRVSARVAPPAAPSAATAAGQPDLPGGWNQEEVVLEAPVHHLPRFAPAMAQVAAAGISGRLSVDRDEPHAYLAQFAPATPRVEQAVSEAFSAEELGARMGRASLRVRCYADHGGLCPMEVVQVTLPVPAG